jgi:hypothetical protein
MEARLCRAPQAGPGNTLAVTVGAALSATVVGVVLAVVIGVLTLVVGWGLVTMLRLAPGKIIPSPPGCTTAA